MSSLSLGTNKLITLSKRYANRDLYDTRFFRTLGRGYDDNLIRERTGKNPIDFLDELIFSLPKKLSTQ
ncbi:MAG TPA: hypothetical protein PLW93_06385 [Candidatus Absconditabacterales bacterium]|nr:hypothetical protein [Candidatus Absconditabacterales bacterium]HNG97877.1 hypothetical protein [Candidatus Absconditabacterales bacterium]